MGLDASDLMLASGVMAASPLFCRGCRLALTLTLTLALALALALNLTLTLKLKP